MHGTAFLRQRVNQASPNVRRYRWSRYAERKIGELEINLSRTRDGAVFDRKASHIEGKTRFRDKLYRR